MCRQGLWRPGQLLPRVLLRSCKEEANMRRHSHKRAGGPGPDQAEDGALCEMRTSSLCVLVTDPEGTAAIISKRLETWV